MSRFLLAGALVVGAVSIFRRDLARIVGVLRAPTTAFIKDVRRELEERPSPGGGADGTAGASGSPSPVVAKDKDDAPKRGGDDGLR